MEWKGRGRREEGTEGGGERVGKGRGKKEIDR